MWNDLIMKFSHLSYWSPIKIFTDLHIMKNLLDAKKALNKQTGIYAIINTITGQLYIGSSNNIAERLHEHLVSRCTNEHLQNSINKYGLEYFLFVVLEFCEPPLLLVREQYFLDWLFLLAEELRYNFASCAEASFTGLKHSEETKVKMSEAKLGENNHFFGGTHSDESKAKMSEAHLGKTLSDETKARISANQPTAITIYACSFPDRTLVYTFASQIEAAKELKVSRCTVQRYLKSGKVLQGKYLLSSSPF